MTSTTCALSFHLVIEWLLGSSVKEWEAKAAHNVFRSRNRGVFIFAAISNDLCENGYRDFRCFIFAWVLIAKIDDLRHGGFDEKIHYFL